MLIPSRLRSFLLSVLDGKQSLLCNLLPSFIVLLEQWDPCGILHGKREHFYPLEAT
jgi:hypothetical protein